MRSPTPVPAVLALVASTALCLPAGACPQGSLGIAVARVEPALAAHLQVDADRSVVVTDVWQGQAGEKAGLKKFDVITHLDGSPVKARGFASRVRRLKVGTTVTLGIVRGCSPHEVKVRVERYRRPKRRRMGCASQRNRVTRVRQVPASPDMIAAVRSAEAARIRARENGLSRRARTLQRKERDLQRHVQRLNSTLSRQRAALERQLADIRKRLSREKGDLQIKLKKLEAQRAALEAQKARLEQERRQLEKAPEDAKKKKKKKRKII